MHGYRKLLVWQMAMNLVENIYQVTHEFPADERYGLTSQLRRAAVSVPSNIAEGYSRSHRGDYLRSLSIARGSLSEVQTQLVLAGRLKFVTRTQLNEPWKLSESVGKMLTRMILQMQLK